MPRSTRACLPGLTQHIVQRGNNRAPMFKDDADYLAFLHMLKNGAARRGVAVHGYALMTNHFHLMATPEDRVSLSKMMQDVGRTYVPFFNRRHQRTGGLWEGRYRSFAIDNEVYWLTCLRYVELNPVRAGLAVKPQDYRWSSARAHASGLVDSLLTCHDQYIQLGGFPAARQQAWRAICGSGVPDAELTWIRAGVRKGQLISPQEAV